MTNTKPLARWLLTTMLVMTLFVNAQAPELLTDPFLQLPEAGSVNVVWFTEFEGTRHNVMADGAEFEAETTKLSRMAEDEKSRVGEQTEDAQVYEGYTPRDIWRHEATVSGLTPGERVPYSVTSVMADGTEVTSDTFTLTPLPEAGQALSILLTSDHQLMPMTTANLEKVAETAGTLDAVFLAGDLINVPDRASEWFDDNRVTESRGGPFFQNLQGRANRVLEYDGVSTTYTGGEIIQHAPLFPIVGNHEVMGRLNKANDTTIQFNDPQPRAAAEARYERFADTINPEGDPAVRDAWIRDNSFNSISYEEIFSLPADSPGGETYYALQFGDVYLIGLYATRIWRTPSLDDGARGKYREALTDLDMPDNWGYGDFIFEDLSVDSAQYTWLQAQLESEAFQASPYKIVMMHQGPHGLGDNYNPVFANPEQVLDYDEDGRLAGVRYEYPIESDILINDIEPLLQEAGVQLVHSGHSHLWFRMKDETGIDWLETSNVGNSYGCYLEGYKERSNVPGDERFDAGNYALTGDPHGLEPIMPGIEAFWTNDAGEPLPCVDSNEITTFSILDTGTGTISSYYFDTRQPDSDVVKFDEFSFTE